MFNKLKLIFHTLWEVEKEFIRDILYYRNHPYLKDVLLEFIGFHLPAIVIAIITLTLIFY